MSVLNIVILAAGKGTRMYSSKPKVLHALAGKPLAQHVLDCAKAMQPQQVCVVYGHGGEAVPSALQGEGVAFALQQPQLGTGHAVQQAMPVLPDEVAGQPSQTLVLYGDVPLIQQASLEKMQQAANENALVLLTVNLDDPSGYGRIVRNSQGLVQSIVEQKDATAEQLAIQEVNTGIMLIPTAKLRGWLQALGNDNAQGEYYLTDIVAMAVAQGVAVNTVQPDYEWETHGINNKTQLATLERTWQQQQALHLMAKGVTLMDAARIDIRGELICGQDVEIDVGCVFEGRVQLGDGVKVGAYSVISEANIAAGSVIKPYTSIEKSDIGEDCWLGPYARLRPGTRLHDRVHVGNFVEIKNSVVATGSKANHLSYIGDADVGSEVNIGAGTITCNYDGANKFRTEIGDNAFIGSDTQLVAPVKIGAGATIGAGSTITKDTPDDTLCLSRSKQITIPGWQRPQKKS